MKNYNLFITFSLVLNIFFNSHTFAATKTSKNHREKHHHSHGSATLSIAFDQVEPKNNEQTRFVGQVEFKSSAHDVLGFEHTPQSEAQKNIFKKTFNEFENQIEEMIQFDKILNCHFKKILIEQKFEGPSKSHTKHSDWVAQYSISCEKSPLSSKIIFNFTRFKNLQDIDVTVLIDQLQKSIEIKKEPLTLELK